MIRVLHVVTTMDFGGVETLLMNIYRNIDREKIQFDFLCMNTCDNLFSDEIKELGGKMYSIPFISKVGLCGFKKNLFVFFKQHKEYQIVHTHINAYNGFVLEAAKKAGVKNRISHVHAVFPKVKNPITQLIRVVGKSKIEKNANCFFACSIDARDSFYLDEGNNDNCIVLHNGIATDRFCFNNEFRNQIREQYELNDKFVIGHVGRFDDYKNQQFCVRIFEKILSKNNEVALMLIGEGTNKEHISNYVNERELENFVIFTGLQENIPAYMSAMDMFLFPSKKEGFGIVAIEAQSTGLPVIASDSVPRETGCTELIEYLPLTDEEAWITKIEELSASRIADRKIFSSKISEKGYDIKTSSKFLSDYYFKLVNR